MINVIRKYQQPALIGVTLLIIVTFVWYWNGTQAGRGGFAVGANKRASIYGRALTDTDITGVQKKFAVADGLGLTDLVQGLAGAAQNRQEAANNFIVNFYVFQHEADALQVFATDTELKDELTRAPGFQTDGRFDGAKLTKFVQDGLPSLGLSDAVIDDLLRDQVRVRKIMALISSTVDLTPAELQNRFTEENEKMDVSVVRLSTSDIEKGIVVTDADAKTAYDQHKETFQSDEQRKVSIASFELSDAQKALKGKDRTDALQQLGDDAWAFAQAVVDKTADFNGLAGKFSGKMEKAGVPVSTSAFFTAAQPDPALTKIPALGSAAFHLSSDYPSSDVLEGTNGYYVLHLADDVPARQLSFDEAKPQIIAQLKKDRASQLIQTKANDVRDHIIAGAKAGKSFADAAAAAGVSAEAVPPFSLLDASKADVPDLQEVAKIAISLGDKQLSEFVPTDAGGLLVYMKGHEPVDKSALALSEPTVKEQFTHQKQVETFVEWLRLRKEAAHLVIFQPTAS